MVKSSSPTTSPTKLTPKQSHKKLARKQAINRMVPDVQSYMQRLIKASHIPLNNAVAYSDTRGNLHVLTIEQMRAVNTARHEAKKEGELLKALLKAADDMASKQTA